MCVHLRIKRVPNEAEVQDARTRIQGLGSVSPSTNPVDLRGWTTVAHSRSERHMKSGTMRDEVTFDT